MPLIPDMLKKKKKKKLVSPVKPTDQAAWGGPIEEGVTQSILSNYLVCKERFRVRYINGISPVGGFNHTVEFGQMWHLCEETFLAGKDPLVPLEKYATKLAQQYREDSIVINKWFNVVRVLFPIYVAYWEEHHTEKLVPLVQEEVFRVPYKLPSGREVLLRGKWDAINLIEGDGIYLQENKSKSKIDVQSIERQLNYDLQTMFYLTALRTQGIGVYGRPGEKLRGVNYNVVRRPLSGGRGTIRPHKATKNKPEETQKEFYERLAYVIKDYENEFFHRWKVQVGSSDIMHFEYKTLIPVLENLCDDYEWWSYCVKKHTDPFDSDRNQLFERHYSRHYRLPYGVYNVVTEGGFHSLDDYLNTGSKIGLENNTEFFPELK